MTGTASTAALLHVALQDLHAGKRMQAERLGRIGEAADDATLRTLIAEEAARAARQAVRLEALADPRGAPANLWIGGVLDDAERDASSHQHGRVRDIALVGAIRKAKAAEIVSGETALALAASVAPTMLDALEANLAEEIATDRALRDRLDALTAIAAH